MPLHYHWAASIHQVFVFPKSVSFLPKALSLLAFSVRIFCEQEAKLRLAYVGAIPQYGVCLFRSSTTLILSLGRYSQNMTFPGECVLGLGIPNSELI